MDWVEEFYRKQGAWSDAYSGGVQAHNVRKASLIGELAGEGLRILELGAGGGQNAAAAADLGHEVTALELVQAAADHCRSLAGSRPGMAVLQGDFYTADPGGGFDVVCYWDGFGIGTDREQRRLLSRFREWLRPGGCALVDVYTPWYAASTIGKGWQAGSASREYGFDAEGCRWLDTWSPLDGGGAVRQSLRCYSPADLSLLLEGTGLQLVGLVAGQGPGREPGTWLDRAELARALSYTAKLSF